LQERSNRLRLTVLALLGGLLALLVVVPAAPADVFTPESGGSPQAQDIDSLYKIVLYISIPIFLIVEGTLIWALVKFRQRKDGPEPAQIRGNQPLELGWTVGAVLVVMLIGVVTFLYLEGIEDPAPSGPDGLALGGVEVASIDQSAPPPGGGETLDIGVNGQQFIWRYDHPGGVFDYYELVVPTNTTVTLKIYASDVVHSWWIPKLGGKMDAVPGHTNKTWFKIAKPGVYTGQCAELCGDNHADMRAQVRAVSPEEYEAYLVERGQGIEDAQRALAQQRRQEERLGGASE